MTQHVTPDCQPPAKIMSDRRVTLICALLAAVGPLSSSLFTPALVTLAKDLGTGPPAVQLTVSVFFLGLAVAQLWCGPLSDQKGRRPVLTAFFLLYSLGSLIALLAARIELLILGRFLQGVGSAAGIAISRAIVRDCFSGKDQVRVQAVVGTILSVGPATAPFLGGLLIGFLSWRFLFVIMLLLGISALAAVRFALIESRPPGSGAPAGALWAAYRMVLRSRRFVLCTLMMGGTNGTVYAQSTVLALVLIDDVGLSPQQYGLLMMSQTVMFLSGSILVSRLIGRLEGRRLIAIGMSLVIIAMCWFPLAYLFLEPETWVILLPIAICGLAMGFTLPTCTAEAVGPFPNHAGAAAAVMGFVQMGSGVLGGFATPLLGDPWLALVVISTVMPGVAVASWLVWRRL